MEEHKYVLGLDLGTNSIGWGMVDASAKRILGAGSRIIPMDAGAVDDFETGKLQSAAAARTQFRQTRRNIERAKARRCRLLRVLNVLGFLPEHFRKQIDFEKHLGQFKDNAEPLLPYAVNAEGKREFIFWDSFNEMLEDFRHNQPERVGDGKKVSLDWTLYYLRKKALTRPVSREELAWVLLSFNAKRGYYQLRGMEETEGEEDDNKEFKVLTVVDVEQGAPSKKYPDKFEYTIRYDNGATATKIHATPPCKAGDRVEAICTTVTDRKGEPKRDAEGQPIISISIPKPDDWTLRKKRTENEIGQAGCTVGAYIYDHLLGDPDTKVRGKLVHTIERKFYRSEVEAILRKQAEFLPELTDPALLAQCAEELYRDPKNEAKRLKAESMAKLLVEDVLFYQRPLRSKRSLIAECPLESYSYVDKETGEIVEKGVKCIPKSHPFFQEFRLWQFISNLRIYQKEGEANGKFCVDQDVTKDFLPDAEAYARLFDYLNGKKDVKEDTVLGHKDFGLDKKSRSNYRWNYPSDKVYPGNRTRQAIPKEYREAFDLRLWHILYSVSDPEEIEKALGHYAEQKGLPKEEFVSALKRTVFTEKDYGAYSEKALKRLLPLMRCGNKWSAESLDGQTLQNIEALLQQSDTMSEAARKACADLGKAEDFQGLPVYKACYVAYDRHAESSDRERWEKPEDIAYYLKHTFRQHSLRNPVVEGVVTETLRLVKEVWEAYGRIDEIHVEMGRNLKQTADARKKDYNRNRQNEEANYRARKLLEEFANPVHGIENVRPYSPLQLEKLRIFEETVMSEHQEEFKKDKDLQAIYADLGRPDKAAKVSQANIKDYIEWLEQKYLSPYTGKPIPLNKLFTDAYHAEHVIPQSRYYDDSMNNKVICESDVNKNKNAMTGYEYILQKGGSIVEGAFGQRFEILKKEAYEELVRKTYAKNNKKMQTLLMEDLPENFTQRMLNDTRYMSRVVLGLLSKVVREEEETEVKSKHVVATNGSITSRLKRDWGINEVWTRLIAPRFMRMNEKTGSSNFGEEREVEGKRFFQPHIPLDKPQVDKKRIDHRHHAMDALVIACTQLNQITYLNTAAANDETKEKRMDLRHKLCHKYRTDSNGNYRWIFNKPWDTFTEDVARVLQGIVVSFKQNLRVVTKHKGGGFVIRKPLHKATFYGKVNLYRTKKVSLAKALENRHRIADRELRKEIQRLIDEGYKTFDAKIFLKYFKDREYKWNGKDISKVEVWTFSDEEEEMIASRKVLDANFKEKDIRSITDTGIQEILLRHLEKYRDEKGKERPDWAFAPEGLRELNENLTELNGGRPHKPIYKVRVSETKGLKFTVGQRGCKRAQYVEAEKNTNLFFAIYQDAEGKRCFETIPLKTAVENLIALKSPAPLQNAEGNQLLFTLSPGDLVYVPKEGEVVTLGALDVSRIYKMVSCTKKQCFFIPQSVSTVLSYGEEFGAINKIELTDNRENIKQNCVKLRIDRLGRITQIIDGL